MSLPSIRSSSTKSLHQCDYLRPHTTAYESNLAELVHLNEQIGSLDSHIHQLTELRHTLRNRAGQLQNLCSPVYALPIEVLSHIFCQVVDPGADLLYASMELYTECVSQSLVLSSVSAHFRRVALATSELWKRVPLDITDDAIDDPVDLVSMLQHCAAHSPYVDVVVCDGLEDMDADSTYDLLFPFVITSKVKALHFVCSSRLELWIEKLPVSSFPILDTLTISQNYLKPGIGINVSFDLRMLTSVTRLGLYGIILDEPFMLPPAVQVLNLFSMHQNLLVPCLNQCPNLIECYAIPEGGYLVEEELPTPVILNYIKRLYWFVDQAPRSISFIQSFQMPSLEFLELSYYGRSDMKLAHLLCCDVSTTLTTFVFKFICRHWNEDNLHHLRQLFGLPFPRLETLEILSAVQATVMLDVIRALRLGCDGCDPKRPYLPSLSSLTLGYDVDKDHFRSLLALLQEWRIGETSSLHIKVISRALTDREHLREEFVSVVGNRQIGMTWGSPELCSL